MTQTSTPSLRTLKDGRKNHSSDEQPHHFERGDQSTRIEEKIQKKTDQYCSSKSDRIQQEEVSERLEQTQNSNDQAGQGNVLHFVARDKIVKRLTLLLVMLFAIWVARDFLIPASNHALHFLSGAFTWIGPVFPLFVVEVTVYLLFEAFTVSSLPRELAQHCRMQAIPFFTLTGTLGTFLSFSADAKIGFSQALHSSIFGIAIGLIVLAVYLFHTVRNAEPDTSSED